MDPKIKEDWVEALRSGEYFQRGGTLDRKDEQCCLGVLCDLLDLDWVRNAFGERVYLHGGHENTAVLPKSLREKLRISLEAQDTLTDMNDSGATFDEIADYIEAEL